MPDPENPYAGQGPVLLDIGGDVGALVVAMPADTDGLEVEIRPAGTTAAAAAGGPAPESSTHAHDHTHDIRGHGHDHDHGHDGAPDHVHPHHPHVGVVARPGVDGPAHTLVYPAVTQGLYELVPLPGDRVVLTAQVKGGVVTYTSWPEPSESG